MPLYMVVHTPLRGPREIADYLKRIAPTFAEANASGRNPARCLRTWDPTPGGRTDYMFCLWEADSPEDIMASLGPMTEYLTVDPMRVEETDWGELALKARAASA